MLFGPSTSTVHCFRLTDHDGCVYIVHPTSYILNSLTFSEEICTMDVPKLECCVDERFKAIFWENTVRIRYTHCAYIEQDYKIG